MAVLLTNWYHHVKRDLTVGNLDPRADLTVLPLELILCITDHLPVASKLAFALTCRPYYNSLFGSFVPLQTRESVEELCQLIEKDIPNVFFCHSCAILHRWYSGWGERRFSYWTPVCQNTFYYSAAFRSGWLLEFAYGNVMFGDVRLAMNRHFYGDLHGHSLWKVEMHNEITTEGLIKAECKRTARILDDELFFLTKRTVWHPSVTLGSLQKHITDSSHRLRLCNHAWVKRPYPVYYELMNLIDTISDSESTTKDGYIALSCPNCLTDYSIRITQRGNPPGWQVQRNPPGWKIEFSVYQQLGSCRSPFDWKWRSMNEQSIFNEPRSLIYPAGIVRRRWDLEDGIDSAFLKDTFASAPTYIDYYISGHRRCPWGSWNHRHNCATYGLDARLQLGNRPPS